MPQQDGRQAYNQGMGGPLAGGPGAGSLAAEHAALRYMDAAQRVHDELRRILTQVSGIALLLMTGPLRTLPETAIRSASAAAAEAAEAVRALPVPQPAAHHHHHLGAASAALLASCAAASACAAPGAGDRDRDRLVAALKSTVAHLRTLARLLPGFEPVNFGQACCAAHAAVPAREWD
ncbi:hypothetical protein ACFOGJ_04875 [Marinibaculum pumilum]|uniref:Uncharacterized protein n=1 Tax=Marinibaculum pumilum TaxID=1766165 RepID=A0ABV7KWQ9_9PROT